MLVLTRTAGESLVVPDLGLTITVVAIKGSTSVRLGFEAPPGLAIYRQEVHDRMSGESVGEVRHQGPAPAGS